ncbi:MAG: hypothetical protein ACK4RS_06445, partial [Thiothrix sp.]
GNLPAVVGSLLKRTDLPIVIWGDNDTSYVGQRYAYEAMKLNSKKIKVEIPADVGDWWDVWNKS